MAAADVPPVESPPAPFDEPRGMGEIISDGVQLMRRHVKATLLLMLPFCAFELMAREGGSTLASRAREQLEVVGTGADIQLDAFVGVAISLAGAVGLLLVSMVVVVLIVAVASVHAVAAIRGEEVVPGDILRRGLRLSGKVLLAEMLFDLALLALTILPWSIGGIAALIVGSGFLQITILVLTTAVWLVLVLTLYLRWVLFPQLIVIEGLGPIAALIRSSELMGPEGVRLLRGPKVKLSVILFIYWCVASVVQSTFLLPLGIVGAMEGIPLEEMPPPLAYVPLWVALPVAIVQVTTNSVLYPIKAYLPTLFYFDLRARYGDADDADPVSEDEATAGAAGEADVDDGTPAAGAPAAGDEAEAEAEGEGG